jgi:hypothetical protein
VTIFEKIVYVLEHETEGHRTSWQPLK